MVSKRPERFKLLELSFRVLNRLWHCHDLATVAGSKFFSAKESSIRFGDRVVGIVLYGEYFFVQQSIAFLAVPVKAVGLLLAPLPF